MHKILVWLCVTFLACLKHEAAPQVYTVPPKQPNFIKPGQLPPSQVEQFFNDGFLVVPRVFSPEELAPVCRGIEQCLDRVVDRLYRGGKIQDKAEKAGFYERLLHIEKQFPGTSVLLHKQGFLPTSFMDLWSHEKLLDILEQFLGPDIAGHPVWNLRTKSPHNSQGSVPWHQDNAYFDSAALSTFIATAWIPLIDATRENGCMQMVRGGHRTGTTATHTCPAGDTWHVQLAESEIESALGVKIPEDVVTCEFEMGGVLFLNNAIPHRSLENTSDKVRWSIDFRWQRPDQPTGMEGIKEAMIMRTSSNPDHIIDWTDMASNDRNKLSEESIGVVTDEFDTTIHGPWMTRWGLTHHNRHTAALYRAQAGSSV